MKVTLATNSDFGVPGKIGFRTLQVAQACARQELQIIARGASKECISDYKEQLRLLPKVYRLFNLILSGITQYLFPFPSRKIQRFLFDCLARRHIGECDIFHSWEACPRSFRTAKKRGAITILDVQMGSPNTNWDFLKKIEPLIDAFIVPSPHVQRLYGRVVPAEKLKLNPFGVDTKFFTPKKKDHKEIIFIFSGQLQERKGIRYLLEAWNELNLPNAKLILCGRHHKSTFKLMKQPPSVIFTGNLPPEELCSLYQSADVFVLPSLFEGSAKATYEAMACGLPIICTFEAGSIVEDGVEGFLIPAKNVASLKRRMRQLYKDKKLRETVGLRARKKVERYTWNSYGERTVKIYQQLLRS